MCDRASACLALPPNTAMNRFGILLACAALVSLPAACVTTNSSPRPAGDAPAAAAPALAYYALVVSESADQIATIRFDGAGARAVDTVKTGLMPTEINGPHGIAVSPDGRFYYVTIAHGTPFGTLWKYRAGTNEVVSRVALGLFPASLQVSPDGAYAYVVNFNLHGDMVPSSVSIVATDDMVEIARITTCTMPHGSRLNPQGTKHYSACMMDDMLVEIDTRSFEISRHFSLGRGREHGAQGPPHVAAAGAAAGGAHAHDAARGEPTCSPTWAQPSADGGKVYVACNKSDEIIEIDVERWEIARRLPAGAGVYNLAVSPDGRLLVATNKRGHSVSIFDLASGRELRRIPTARKVVHGAAVTPDSRYAFITVEGIGSEPGTVEVIDLRALESVARADVGQQAAGIDFWKSEPLR